MKLLISDPSPGVMAYYEELLSEHGFSIRHTNYGSLGGSSGQCPELWIMHDEDFDAASTLIQEFPHLTSPEERTSWTCPKCSEVIEPEFDTCWNCSTPRPRLA
ncbi:MAG: hypothetical protein EOP84_08540 [Verrucomicrobiaceae bacterium]|nr:MAG: hypothetical protein EOP84_08540 [Verrucomicrobiaceae bacterium]